MQKQKEYIRLLAKELTEAFENKNKYFYSVRIWNKEARKKYFELRDIYLNKEDTFMGYFRGETNKF
mgnify:CR=1 FL=1